ncbi:protein stunted isoform X2 [Drosophila serrata]|uniref:protein stunted isoform X2 n=1 Tax=Drosophila serrata TaxID=7274 RepID=UPI000A1D250E|nr:protein stunted isoform X2 [Drosophila serrata]
MTAWRAAGITYIQYSNIAARVLRESLRTELRADAAKRNESHVKFTPWANGRPAHEKA